MTTTLPPDLDGHPSSASVPAPGGSSAEPTRRPGRPLPRWVRGRAEDASWVRPALLGLLVATAALYLYGLSASGWANSFYSAAVQAGSQSWKALFFGSSDASKSITVDKPPVSIWVMGISARLFGVDSWAILAPQALMGVASVGLLYASVRRAFTPSAGLLAGLVLAVTPVATLMFRFNNPDALLVLLLVAAAYAIGRAVEQGKTRWLVITGALIGTAFLTKMLQALLVVPGLAVVYLLAGPHTVLPVRAAADRPGRDGGLRGLVHRDRRAVARVEPSLHRGLADQLDPRTHPRLQRPGPAHRERDQAASEVVPAGLPAARRCGGPPASAACSAARSAHRSPG